MRACASNTACRLALSKGGAHSITRSPRRPRETASPPERAPPVSDSAFLGASSRKLSPAPSGLQVGSRGSISRFARVAESGSIPVSSGVVVRVASTLPRASQISCFFPNCPTGTR